MAFSDFEVVAPPPFLPELSTVRQGTELTMIALGVGEHPALALGNHLRWSFDPNLGFPQRGFALWRRPHVEPSLQVFSFANEPRRTLSRVESFGAFRWLSGHTPLFITATIERSQIDPANSNMLVPASNVNTCAFDPALGALRRIVIELVHAYDGPPTTLTVWGTYKEQRVAGNSLVISTANRDLPLSLTIDADALDGFQFLPGPWGILSIGYAFVSWDVLYGWTPLWPDVIGLPMTTPGYRVLHKHSADPVAMRDWFEAADRMSPTGQAADLPQVLADIFGPPEFDNTRSLMRDAILRRPIVVAEQNDRPAIEIDPVRLLMTAAIDPRVATMLGLAWIDRTAEPGVAYDYRIAGFWHQPLKPKKPDRLLVPGRGLGFILGVPHFARTFPTGLTLALESRSTEGEIDDWPTVTLARGLELHPQFPLDALRGLRVRKRGGDAIRPRAVRAAASRRLYQIRLDRPVTQLTVRGKGGEDPWAVLAVSGDEVVAAAASAGGAASLRLEATRIDSLWIGGAAVLVDRIDLQPDEPPIKAREWICYNVVRGPVRTLEPPGISGETVPGFARASRPEQIVALFVETESDQPAGPFFQLARTGHEPVSFDISRRADDNAPIAGVEGDWTILNFNQETLQIEPIIPGRNRPPLLLEPDDWPPDPPHFLDTTIDPAVRWYGYRALGRDLFGRTSQWSNVLNVDAADRWGPPLPSDVGARWIERGDIRATADDVALLNRLDRPFAIRVQWDWPENLRAQAPDTARFRVYWTSEPFEEYLLAEIVEVLNPTAPDTYRVRVLLPRIQNPPADAFAGDWLRQGNEQYFISSSSAANPIVLTLTRGASPPPAIGDCSVSLRRPADLDQSGNPLRQDSANPLSWDERAHQGPLISIRTNVNEITPVTIEVLAVGVDSPRPGTATLQLATTFRWDDPDLSGWRVVTNAEIYPVLGGILGANIATLVVNIEGRAVPGPGIVQLQNATNSMGLLNTVLLEAQVPNAAPFELRGGVTAMDPIAPVGPIVGPVDVPPSPRSQVIGYRTGPRLELIVSRTSAAAQVRWWPDYEALITDRELVVSEHRTSAIGVIGVSAVDDRDYRPDVRARAGEPSAPGNEGPIQSTRVRRSYFGRPSVQPEPDGVAGPDPLWAPEPEAFSAISRFPLRWPTGGAARFHVAHATLNAILDFDVTARRARRGIYAGQPELDEAGLVAHRAQQATLDAQGQRALANNYAEAFSDLTTEPIEANDARWTRAQPAGMLRWHAPIDGKAPGRHFLRVIAVDAAGNRGEPGPVTLPIIVPDVRRPATPNLRRSIPDEHCVWIEWDHGGPDTTEFSIFRIEAATGTSPDIRQMQRIATVPVGQTPQPQSVFAGAVSSRGPVDQVVAVYPARDYDVTLGPLVQPVAPVPGPYQLAAGHVTGLNLVDGTLVHIVVVRVAGEQPELISSGSAHAFCDRTAVVDVEYAYRVVATRLAQTGLARSRPVDSLPSGIARGSAIDSSRPEPPAAQAVWDAALGAVVVTWNAAGRAPEETVLLQRLNAEMEVPSFKRISLWTPIDVARLEDRSVESGHTYTYRLRTRRGTARVSQNEPELGPIAVP